MNATICQPAEPADEPGPRFPGEREISSLKRRFSTERLYIDECNVGLGVFAQRDLLPGEVILALEGPMIDFAETKRRGTRECMAIQIGPDQYIDTRPPGVFVNHSCEPNSGIKGSQFLVALRRIRKGEEIRYDYSTTMEEQSFTMDCRCGAPTCRRIVMDFSTLPRRLRDQYLSQGIVMDFILARLPDARDSDSPQSGRFETRRVGDRRSVDCPGGASQCSAESADAD